MDLGGGTSDLCFLCVERISSHWVCRPLGPIRGLSRGSNDIDRKFQYDVRSRLHIAGIPAISELAYKMSRGPDYQRLKMSCDALNNPGQSISIGIPDCGKQYDNEEAGIHDGKMNLLVS